MVRSLSQKLNLPMTLWERKSFKAVNLQSVWSGHFLRQQKHTEALKPLFYLSVFAAWNSFFSAEIVLTVPAFSFAFTVCIDTFLTLCSLCILFSICHAIKPTLDSAMKCSHALILEKKELGYKRHFMKVLAVAICDWLCRMEPLWNCKSIHFSSMASSAGVGYVCRGQNGWKKGNVYVVLREK